MVTREYSSNRERGKNIVLQEIRNGLGSNLYRLGVPDMVIQRILRHANVSTTATYYIKTVADDVRSAMTTLENNIPTAQSDTQGTLSTSTHPAPTSVN